MPETYDKDQHVKRTIDQFQKLGLDTAIKAGDEMTSEQISQQPIAIVTQVTIVPRGQSKLDPRAFKVSVADEGAGEFVRLECEDGSVPIDPSEWSVLKHEIDQMIGRCQR